MRETISDTMTDAMSSTATFFDKRSSRRTFLAAAGVAGAGLAFAGNVRRSVAAPSASGDIQAAMLAASLEVLAVNTYKAALAAAMAGKLGTVPPAVANYVQTAISQHQFALDQWNMVLTGAGRSAVGSPPSDLNATVQQMFGQVTDVVGAAKLALLLEQTAADTYYVTVPNLLSKDAINLAGNLEIIDQQHAAILLFVLGQYPVPQTFVTGDKAYGGRAPSSVQGPPSS